LAFRRLARRRRAEARWAHRKLVEGVTVKRL